jgi:hypothetical protein
VLLLAPLLIGFRVWMFIDALRRGAPRLWLFVLWLPFGDLAYFFMVKLADLGARPAALPNEPLPVDLPGLRAAVEDSPSFANRVALAWALLREGEPAEAQRYFELARRSHPGDRDALHGHALAELEAGSRQRGIELLSELVDRQLSYDDYRAAQKLAELLSDDGEQETALELARAVARATHRFAHRLELGRHEARAGRAGDARDTLARLLAELEALPDYQRRREQAVREQAQRLLLELHTP